MELGAFSVSLAVKDLEASRQFYEKFGFKAFAGDPSQNWLILKNGDHVIGLFQGMLDKNTLTFNPGWDSNAQQLDAFTDVRELQRQLKAQGVPLVLEANESTTGPASLIAVDPDGNPSSSISTSELKSCDLGFGEHAHAGSAAISRCCDSGTSSSSAPAGIDG